MDADDHHEEPKFGNKWEKFENDLNDVSAEIRDAGMSRERCRRTTSQLSEMDKRKSNFLDDLDWFKEASDETNKQIEEQTIDDKIKEKMYENEPAFFQSEMRQDIEKYDMMRCEPEKIELRAVEKCTKKRSTIESEIFEKILSERKSRNSKIFDKETDKTEKETFDKTVKASDKKICEESTKYQYDTATNKVVSNALSPTDSAKIGVQAVSLQGIYNIKKDEEKYTCEVSDICQLSDDIMVITDERNKSVKTLDVNYFITAYLKLPDAPFGICNIDKKEVAITLSSKKKVQIISVKNKMTMKKCFKVRDICRGITYFDGLFYICCGGSPSGDHDDFESQGHLGVYSVSGTFLSSYTKGISSPRYVCLSYDSTKIFVTDHYNGIIVLDLDGRFESQMNHDACTYPSGVCCLKEGLLCAAYHQRNEIVSFVETGLMNSVMLQRKDGIVAPRSVYYDFHRARLIVSTMWGENTIKVFNLHLN